MVSNRVPFPAQTGGPPTAGGLAVAIEAALKRRGGLWFGWSGKAMVGDDEPELQRRDIGQVTYAVIDLPRRDIDEYYNGFANRALWPVCHYRLDLLEIASKDTAGYFRVNALFARKLAPLIRDDDVIWIHDYHFIPLAAALRELGCRNRIGFFLHIPWAPHDVASALPAFEAVVRAITRFDLVGFQTPNDVDNFSGCLLRSGLARPLADGHWEADGHIFRIDAFPIGIDTEAFRQEARDGKANAVVRRTRLSLPGKRLIIGVDRLDYSKGIRQRLDAFAMLLARHSEHRGRVTFLQITPKSRSEVAEYRKMQDEVAQQIGATNGKYGDVDWTPVRYINKAVSRTSLAGLYRLADVGLVTPLRDGMNLVAKEYVAAQAARNPGVLVLSRFAGAAAELDGAILVNPYDTEGTGAAIAHALAMPVEERRERWTTMIAKLRAGHVDGWCARFLATLAEDAGADQRSKMA
jgi:trehalose 6-phosphate synthase